MLFSRLLTFISKIFIALNLFVLNFISAWPSFADIHKEKRVEKTISKEAELYLRDTFNIIKANSLMRKNINCLILMAKIMMR